MDDEKKNDILNFAILSNCDLDGDLILYKDGRMYFVHIWKGIVKEAMKGE